ncbi:DUF421 domain-containing protein [Paenibacillus filicis]|uniref:DUF421 domain-containing protein n=1 Tax=Paenibacillus filicis TaxID=669464 RepID=A0ABU9DNN4_9BACL
MNEYIYTFFRTIAAFAMLLIIARILGKQMLSNMTFHDFVTGITLGSMAANLAFNVKIQSAHFFISLAVITAISFGISVLSLQSRKARKWITSSPTILIEGGKILEQNMKKIKCSLDALNQSLREKDIFDIEEVEYAVMEDNGKLSVLKKPQYRNVTLEDLHRSAKSTKNFPIELIMDGQLIKENLTQHEVSQRWLETELDKRKKRIDDVFYAVKSTSGKLILDFYDDGLKRPIDQEN